MVRWIAPTGRMALGGSVSPLVSSGAVISAESLCREEYRCGREVGVARGRSRKCVSCGLGFGGMVGGVVPWVEKGCGGGLRRGEGFEEVEM